MVGCRAFTAWALLISAVCATQPAAGQDAGPVTLRAERQEWMRDNYWRGEGQVQVQYQDITIRCEELEIDLSTLDLLARGEVVLDRGPQRLTAEEVTFNLREKTGTFRQATGNLAPTYHFTAEELIKLDETRYRIRRGTFTSCELNGAPPWEFGVRKATLEEEGYGHFHGATLRIKRVPIFYWPYIVWPIKTERAAGLLVPSFGYSSRRGAYIGNAFFLPLGRSYDTTMYLDLYSMGSIGLGNRWRWAPRKDAYGEIELYAIYDHLGETFEWKVDGRHEQDDLLGFRVLSEIHDISDIDFFREFERSYDRNTLRSLYSYLYFTRRVGPGSLNIRFDRRKTFLSLNDIVMNQLPEAEYRVPARRVGQSALYWSLISSAALFDVDRGEDLATTYGRVDLFPSLSYSVPSPAWLTLTPSVGGRATYYSSRLGAGEYQDEGLDRSYATGGLDVVGPAFSRIFDTGFAGYERLKHLIEPRIEYSYVSDPGDTGSVPVFDEVDSVLVTNRVRVSLVNSLYGRSEKDGSVSELGSFELGQEYSFGDALNRSSLGDQESQRGPVEGALRLTPKPWLYVDARARYDTLFDSLQSTSLSASLRGRDRSVNMTWYQAYIPELGDRTSSQARLTGSWGGFDDPIQVKLSLAFDVEENEFVQQRALVRYVGSCWGVSVEYRDYQYGLYPTRDYRISIDFKGIGKFIELQGDFETGENQL